VSLNEILGSAISGLAASQAGLRNVSSNIANVNTPGYARQRLALSTSVTAGRITGVVTGEPQRVADRFLEANAYRRAGDVGRADVQSTYQDRLQALLGAPGAESGLPARLDAIKASAIAMSAFQASAQTGAAFVSNVEDAINSMQQIRSDVDVLRADADAEVTAEIDNINELLARIHGLNENISQQKGLGRVPAGALDQRNAALDTLSGLARVTIRDQPDGRVTIDSASGAVLLDRRLRQLSYASGTTGVSQPVYPPIEVRFVGDNGAPGALTGERLDSATAGGKLGGLLGLRDNILPEFSEKLGVLFSGISQTLNAASNAATAVPVPGQLEGRNTGLVGADRLGFTGAAQFSVIGNDGAMLAKTSIDFTSLGPAATIDDAVAAINAGLAGAGTASFADGKLVLTGNGGGIAVTQVASNPSDRAGSGFSQYFGLNDIVRSDDSPLVASGLVASDPHGFAAGQSVQIVLRDYNGKTLASHALAGSAGTTMGDLITELNASDIGSYGSFALDSRGRVNFAGSNGMNGAQLVISSDSTERFGSGRSFSSLAGLNGTQSGLRTAQVRSDLAVNPALLPLAQVQTDAAVGAKAVGANDLRGALAYADELAAVVDFGKDGAVTTAAIAQNVIAKTGANAAQARDSLADANVRREDAINRRDSFAGVNIDEELAQMVVLQNSYSASARVIATASAMYDTLLAMIG